MAFCLADVLLPSVIHTVTLHLANDPVSLCALFSADLSLPVLQYVLIAVRLLATLYCGCPSIPSVLDAVVLVTGRASHSIKILHQKSAKVLVWKTDGRPGLTRSNLWKTSCAEGCHNMPPPPQVDLFTLNVLSK